MYDECLVYLVFSPFSQVCFDLVLAPFGDLLSVLPALLLLLNGLDQLPTFVVGDELAPALRDQVLVFLEEGTRLDGGLGQTETSSELVVQSVHQLSLLPARSTSSH